MAPGENPICLDLLTPKLTWQEKASQILDMIRKYYCVQTFWEESENLPASVLDCINETRAIPESFLQFKPKESEPKSSQEEKITPISGASAQLQLPTI